MDPNCNQTIIEENTSNGVILQRTTTHIMQNPVREAPQRPESVFIIPGGQGGAFLFSPMDHGMGLFGNLDLNFRSFFDNDSIMQHILRLSEMDRGRSGTPPASKEVVEKLPEIEITDEDCKCSGSTKEYPRCSICCEDLKDKASKLPCGHLFNKECISEWLGRHNQCPVCRFELPTDDAEYERRKAASNI
jgi:hypothetical protein